MRREEVVEIGFYDRASRKSQHRHLLRVAGPIGFVIVMLAALLAITAYSYHSNRRGTLVLADDLLGAIERRIVSELKSYFGPIRDTVRLTADFFNHTSFGVHNRDLIEPIAFRLLDNIPQVTNFIVADPQGNFLMVARQSDGSLHTKIIARTTEASRVTWIRRDTSGKVIAEETSVDDAYDPRKRPWYTAAVTSGDISWSDFYVFFTSQTHGATISVPILGDDDQLQGVFGLDIELKVISAFLKTLKIGRRGEAIIVDEDGYIIAHPEIEKVIKKEGDVYKPIRVEELGNRVLNRAYNRFRIDGYGRRDLTVDGKRFLTSAFVLPRKTGGKLSVFILVPEEDFVGFVSRNNHAILLMSSGIVALAALMAGLLVFQSLRAERSARLVLDRQDELEAQSRAFSELSSTAALFDAADIDSFRRLTKIVTDAVSLRRTSVWRFDDDGQFLRCVDSYDRESNGHTQGTVLARTDFALLFDMLHNGEDIRSENAQSDSRVAELYRVYLQPLGCESYLAIPIRYHAQTLGALWFEHERMTQNWSDEEISFAHAIANMLALRFSVDRKAIPAAAYQEGKIVNVRDPAAPKAAVESAADEIRPEISSAKTDMTARPTQRAAAAGTNHFTSFLDRLTAGGIDPAQSAADIFTDTTVLVLRFTNSITLGMRAEGSGSSTIADLIVSYLEELAASLQIEYLKVMGDEIVCAAGIESGSKDHARRIADLALSIQDRCSRLLAALDAPMEFQIGVDTGAVMGCAVGRQQQERNIWGEAFRFASKMAGTGISGGIQVSQTTYQRLRSGYLFKARGRFYLPNIGETSTYLLTGRL